MTPAVKFAQEWDTARFTIPGRAGPGEYLIHMFWKVTSACVCHHRGRSHVSHECGDPATTDTTTALV